MKISQICGCSILTIIGILLLAVGFTGEVAYFKSAPGVPIYFGVLFLSLAAMSWSVTLAKPKDEY